jgi:hypothetical protein
LSITPRPLDLSTVVHPPDRFSTDPIRSSDIPAMQMVKIALAAAQLPTIPMKKRK